MTGLNKESFKEVQTLREMFGKRKEVKLGLTKYEVIALLHNRKVSEIVKHSDSKINQWWVGIKYLIKALRKEKLMAIVCIRMPHGTVLYDENLGKRLLKKSEFIYYRCSEMNTATQIKSRYDKIANGLIRAEKEVIKITEEEIKETPLIEELLKN